MGRFLLIGIAALFVIVTVIRLIKGEDLTVLDWVLFFVGLVATGSLISYLIQSH